MGTLGKYRASGSGRYAEMQVPPKAGKQTCKPISG